MRRKAARWARQALAYTLIICILFSMTPTSYAMEAGETLKIIGEGEANNNSTETVDEPVIEGKTELSGEQTNLNGVPGTETETSKETTPEEEITPEEETTPEEENVNNVDSIPENDTITSEGKENLIENQGLVVNTEEVTNNNSANGMDISTDGEELTSEENSLVFLAGVDAQSTEGLTLGAVIQLATVFRTEHSELQQPPILMIDDGETLNIYNGEGLILLSQANPAEYQSKKLVLLVQGGSSWDTINDITVGGTTYSYQGLGSEGVPFCGEISIDNTASALSIQTKQSLFRAISTDATVSTPISFSLVQEMDQPLFAEQVICGSNSAKVSFTVSLNPPNVDDPAKNIGGILGKLQSNAKAAMTVINNCTSDLTVSGTSHRGLFCNEMDTDAELVAKFVSSSSVTSSSVTVSSTGGDGDAGGFVGHMVGNNSLTSSGDLLSEVTSLTGNAGGLVGSATNATIQVAPNESFSFESISIAAGENAGGLIGEYTNLKTDTLSLDTFFGNNTMITLSAGKNAGGVFGAFKNRGSYTICGKTVNSKLSSATGTYGGLIGSYQADALTNTLSISGSDITNISVSSSGGSQSTIYGGVFGKVVGPSYVSVENVTVTTADMPVKSTSASTYDFYFGGLVGIAGGDEGDTSGSPMLNVGDVKLITSVDKDIALVSDVKGRGGLIGYFKEGVLRLHGTTDLSKQTMTQPSDSGAAPIIGQIIGYNDNGFVYGVGDGNGKYNNDAVGWQLIRYNGVKTSDIGTWGQVIRLDGVNLSEGNTSNTDLIYFNSTEHTVTIMSSFQKQNGESYNISTLRDFAAYVLGFNYSGVNSGTLMFSKSVEANDTQTVNITADIDLTGTGILGIGRDFGTRTGDKLNINPCGPMFRGTINGMISENSKSKITLDIGHISFGTIGSAENASDDVCSGGIKVWDVVDKVHCHAFLGLIAATGDSATIQNLEIAGNVMALGSDRNQTWQAFVAGGVALATGDITFTNVTVSTDVSANGFRSYYQAGFVAAEKGFGMKLSFEDCTWQGTLYNESTAEVNMIGGLIAHANYKQTVTVSGCTLSGTLEARGTKNTTETGGLIAHFEPNKDNSSSIALSNLEVTNAKIFNHGINDNKASAKGGLLGYSWPNTNVTFGAQGVTISGCTLEAGNTQFGGLVYQATGYWKATENNSIKFVKGTDPDTTNSISGSTAQDNPSGLLVHTGLMKISNVDHALYLEVGTFGKDGSSYYIKNGAVTLTLTGGDYFDELVGKTIADNAGNNNAVVSLAVRGGDGTAAKIDAESTCNTYTGQLGGMYKNGKTRYYYNLDSYRIPNGETGLSGLSSDSLDSAEDVVSWSVSQYAASNIRNRFCSIKNSNASISGNIDLTGYSYYPVTPLGGVTVGNNTTPTTVKFDFYAMNVVESAKKPLGDSAHQHYLMHHGLLYNTGYNVTVNNTTFKGTVGLQSASNSTNSGALIFGNVSGDPIKDPIKIELTNVILEGLKVASVDKATTYAPLLVNKISQATKLTVTGLSTGEGYAANAYAATSLIGNVGSSSATKLTLLFSNIALDGRTETAKGEETVFNNGRKQVNYKTTHSIFTRATLLESFQYQSEGSGVYNFNSTDDKVTYGVELSNSGETGRNPGKQYMYYDAGYVTDEEGKTGADETYVKGRYTSDNFVRYVGRPENYDNNSSYHEIDINLKVTGLTEGCGTYGDPYLITNADQLISLAKFFSGTGADGLQVKFNSKVLSEKKQTLGSYHLKDSVLSEETGYDYIYTYSNSSWSPADENADAIDKGIACLYLQNAYYRIQNDINLSAKEFIGIGTSTTPFCGVIVGLNHNKIIFSGTNEDKISYGFIKFSQGSVVKDLTVDYSGASITMSNAAVPSSSNNPFFGGVVGYCMGGDTIIDNVSVNYGSSSVTLSALSGLKPRLIAAGGYVGLVGGAKDSDGYEKTGGGVVFRNMSENTNNFADCQNNAQTDTSYFFCNPYVGRVLDGYACYDTQKKGSFTTFTLNNTDKNYTIPDLVMEDTKGLSLAWDDTNKAYSATVKNAQGLWLLSAIVNSGAGAMDSQGIYQDVDNQFVEAYQYGKVRSGSYDKIGTEEGSSDLADEAYWGGVASVKDTDDAKARVSYLVKNYTTSEAAHLTGRSITSGNDAKNSSNNPIALTFATGKIDMEPYANGFRGIGGSYGYIFNLWDQTGSVPKLYRRTLLVKSIDYQDSSAATGETNSVTTIVLNMNQKEYYEQNINTTYESGWWNHGVGLFPEFSYSENCTVQKLTLTGNVSLTMYGMDGKESFLKKKDYDAFVGGFAGRVVNSKDELKFNTFSLIGLTIYGGTATGGAIGCIDGTGGAKKVFFNSFSINNVRVEKKVYHDGSTGGLLGWNRKSNITIGDSSSATMNVVNNLEILVTAGTVQYANAGGLVGASDSFNTTIQNVKVDTLSVTGTNTRDIGGLVASFRESGTLTISNCELNNITINGDATAGKSDESSDRNVGGIVGYVNQKVSKISKVKILGNSKMKATGCNNLGGMIGYTNQALTFDDCYITGKLDFSGRSTPYLGGFLGRSNTGNTVTIKNCTEENLILLSGDSDAGGLVGKMTNGSTNVSNVVFNNVTVATKNNNNYVGLLTGNTNGKTINGYNILANSCKVGYNTNEDVTIDNLSSSTLANNVKTGLWLGNSGGTSVLVAVAVAGTNQPLKDVGNGTASITYADYPADQNYKPNGTNGTPQSANPWLDVNPKSNVVVKDSANATSSTTLTGNGVGYLTDPNAGGTYDSVAKTILTEAKNATSTSDRRYFNTPSGTDRDLAKLLVTSNDIYLTSYQEEEKGTTNVPEGVDLPILVVNSTADADATIWKYIAALTNVADGNTAKGQVSSITAATYKWELAEGSTDTSTGSFIKQNSSSLSVSDKTISITSKAYDNQKSQFTLLDVKYADPTGNNTNGFHLYVPILIKRVLEAKLSVKFLAGTNYRADAYTNVKNYATADFGEPVTAYIEYNYNRSGEEWQAMIDQGENLLWSYSKILDLAKGNSNASPLPAGTRLTLVDRQTGKSYTHTLTEGDNVHSLDLSVLKDSQGTGFISVPVCDLLGITCAPYSGSGTAYVQETDPANATVKIGITYYRMATSEDTAEKFTLTVNEQIPSVAGANNYLPQGEGYYFTIQVPKPESAENITINNNLNQSSEALKSGNGAPAAKIMQTYASNYVLYEGISQSFTQSSKRLVSGNTEANNTEMENGDSIQVTLTTVLRLTTQGQKNFNNLGPEQVNHQFELAMQQLVQDVTTDTVVGAEGVTYTYQVTQGETTVYSDSDTVHGSESKDVLELKYGSTDLKNALVTGTVTITATITMNYPMTGQYFPVRSNDTDQSGIMVKSVSKIANVDSQLPITANKLNASDDNRFYTKNASNAKLSYFSYDKNGTSDATQQLGVNPSDDENNRTTMIYTQGDYDYSAISAADLEKAKTIRYVLELFCKDENGSYNENAPLGRMGEYLPVVKIDGGDSLTIASDTPSMTYEKDFELDTVSYHDFVKINVVPLTGAEFEGKGFSYSNYKLRLTAVLLEADGNEITVSKASDYIIYTNAKVYQHIFQ